MKIKNVVHTVGTVLIIAVSAWTQGLPTVAVLDFIGKGVSAEEASVLTDKLRGELVNSGTVQVIERGAMDEILREQGFQQSGCTSNECIVEVGQLIGVRFMVAGSIGKIEKTFLLSVRLINVATSRIEKNVQREITGTLTDVLKDAIAEVAAELTTSETSPEPQTPRKGKAKTPEKPAPRVKRQPPQQHAPAAGRMMRWRIGLSFCKGFGSFEYIDTVNAWYDNGMLSPSGVKFDFGVRLRYHYLGIEGITGRSPTKTLSNSRHEFYRTIAGVSVVWYFERLSFGQTVTLAPGLGIGYNSIIDHGSYAGYLNTKSTDVKFVRFASPRIKFQVDARRLFFVIEYALLLGPKDTEEAVVWVHTDDQADYPEGKHYIGLASVLCGGIGIKF